MDNNTINANNAIKIRKKVARIEKIKSEKKKNVAKAFACAALAAHNGTLGTLMLLGETNTFEFVSAIILVTTATVPLYITGDSIKKVIDINKEMNLLKYDIQNPYVKYSKIRTR